MFYKIQFVFMNKVLILTLALTELVEAAIGVFGEVFQISGIVIPTAIISIICGISNQHIGTEPSIGRDGHDEADECGQSRQQKRPAKKTGLRRHFYKFASTLKLTPPRLPPPMLTLQK